VATKRIKAEAFEERPAPPYPEGFHLVVDGLPTRKGQLLTLYVMYDDRTVAYGAGVGRDPEHSLALSKAGELDMWIPRAGRGEVQFRIVDETDAEDPKALAAGSA
jgi:hypothetical protein